MTEERDFSAPSILILDLETSGLYRRELSPVDAAQPWAMQAAACLCNRSGTMTNAFSHIIKAENRKAKQGAFAVHGISDKVAARIGIPEPRLLGTLIDMLKTAPLDEPLKVVTYGDFDPQVISSLLARFAVSQGKAPETYMRVWQSRPLTEFINLMDPLCTDACKLPSAEGFEGYKWPSLDEAADIILGRPSRVGFHDGWSDMTILKDLYFHFAGLGIFEREPQQ